MRKHQRLIAITLLLGAGPLACDREATPEDELRSQAPAGVVHAPAELSPAATTPAEPVAKVLLTPASDPAPPSAQWRSWVASEVGRAQAEAPEWAAHVLSVQPKLARSGVLRLVDPALEHPAAAPLLLHRLESGEGAPELRAAIAGALATTGLDTSTIVLELLGSEPEPLVREGLLWALRRGQGPAVIAGLELALADPDPIVRRSAAMHASRFTAGSTEGTELADSLATSLIGALDDVDVDVRLTAARSLGALGVEAAKPALTGMLGASEPKLRLAALQALDRIDPSYAEGLQQLGALQQDSDPKVAAAAAKIASR